MIRELVFSIAFGASVYAQGTFDPGAMAFQAQQDAREDSDYKNGRSALDNSQWDQAIKYFDASISHHSSVTDGALYWKAYAQSRAGRRDQALTTIAQLQKSYPSSRWLNDAQALQVEIRAKSGDPVNPVAESNEELKIIALNSLMQSDPNQAFPILEKLLRGNYSPAIKDKALFILTQNSSAQSEKLLGDIARGASGPEQQMRAIKYMGMMGNEDSRKQLIGIYESTSDVNIKHAILKSFMVSGSRAFLLSVAKKETNPELQHDAIRQLALTGAQDELWQLYQSTNAVEARREILKSMFMTGNSTRLVEVAQSEKDPELRTAAIKSLGLMGGNGRGDVLVGIYKSDKNREVRDAVINALFLQANGKALVDLARAETNPEMKAEIVKKMSLVHTSETTAYMMEILQ